MVLPFAADRAGGMVRRRVRQKLQHRQRRDRLARARFTHQRDGLPLLDLERDAIDRERLALALPERDRKVLDLEQVIVRCFHRAHPNVLRGSKASRTASPMKIKSESMVATVKKPQMPSHGA